MSWNYFFEKEKITHRTNVVKASRIDQDLLQDEGGHRFRQLGTIVHDVQAQWHDLRRQQEVYDVILVGLHQGANNAQGGESQVLETALGTEKAISRTFL